MPGTDGYTLLRRVRATLGRVPLAVAVTALARPIDREHALAAGFAAHVAKPIVPGKFVQLLARLVSEASP